MSACVVADIERNEPAFVFLLFFWREWDLAGLAVTDFQLASCCDLEENLQGIWQLGVCRFYIWLLLLLLFAERKLM